MGATPWLMHGLGAHRARAVFPVLSSRLLEQEAESALGFKSSQGRCPGSGKEPQAEGPERAGNSQAACRKQRLDLRIHIGSRNKSCILSSRCRPQLPAHVHLGRLVQQSVPAESSANRRQKTHTATKRLHPALNTRSFLFHPALRRTTVISASDGSQTQNQQG